MKLGSLDKAGGKLRAFLSDHPSYAEGWYLLSFCETDVQSAIFDLQKAREAWFGKEKDRAASLLRWFEREPDYEYQETNLEVTPRIVRLDGNHPGLWAEQIDATTREWWEQDQQGLQRKINAFAAEGWEILTTIGPESYLLKKQSRAGAFDNFSRRGHPAGSTRARGQGLRDIVGLVAGLTVVIVFATGGLGLLVVPVAVLGVFVYALLRLEHEISPVGFRVWMRRIGGAQQRK